MATTTPEPVPARKRIIRIVGVLAAVVGIAIAANAYHEAQADKKAERAYCEFIADVSIDEC